MKLNLTVFSEEHKNILRAQRTLALEMLGTFAAYLIENGDAEPTWPIQLNQGHLLNYYDVIPDKGPLRSHDIDLELFVIDEHGGAERKTFKKDVLKANSALIRVVVCKLKERKAKLMQMLSGISAEQLELINAHIAHTENLIKKCIQLKNNSQLLVAEVGGLHFLEQILLRLNEYDLNSFTHDNYAAFAMNLDELKQLLHQYSPENNTDDPALFYQKKDIIELRQQFNKIFSESKSLLHSFTVDGLLAPEQEQEVVADFNHLQHLFFAKCDVFFVMLTLPK